MRGGLDHSVSLCRLSSMKIFIFVCLVAATVCLPMAASAQNPTAYSLAADFSATDAVIELDVPPDVDGAAFLIVWDTGKERYSRMSHARAGRHCYEMRHHPQWRGHIKVVAITMRVPGRLKKPTLSDEIDMFLEPERIAPGTINLLVGHTLFGWPWNAVLFLILPLSSLCFAKFKKIRLVHSLVLGFVVSWALMDLRNVYDHAVIVYKMERYRQGMFPLTDVKVFADRASEIIGRATWGHAPLDWPMSTFLSYRLAEQAYVPAGSERLPAFWITKDPKEGQVFLQSLSGPVESANYYLVKKNQP